MTVLNTSSSANSGENKSFFSHMVDPAKLNAIRPKTKGVTEVRFIPEVNADGSIMPAVMGTSPEGDLDVSNAISYMVAINAGTTAQKFTGIVDPSDINPPPKDSSLPFAGLWIRAKSALKPPKLALLSLQMREDIRMMLEKNERGVTPLPRPERVVFMQCVVLVENDKTLPKPAVKQVVALSVSAVAALNKLIREQQALGIDVFSPDKGVTIKFSGVPASKEEGRMTPTFVTSVGRALPLKEDICRRLWVPWQSGLRRYTMAQLMESSVASYGRPLMEYLFPTEVEQYLLPAGAAPAAAAPAPAASRPAPAAAAVSAPAMELSISEEDLLAPPEAVGAEAVSEPVPPPAPSLALAKVEKAAAAKATASAPSVAAASDADLEAQMRELLGGSDEGDE